MSIQQQLQKIVNRVDIKMNKAANEIMQKTKEKLKESINNLWYGSYSPQDYSRSYDLINAVNGRVIKNNQGDYSIEIYFDAELMSSRPNLHSWGTHSGFDGKDFRKGLIDSIIHGMKGSKNNPRYGESTNVIEVVQEEAERYANSILKNYL